MEEKASRSAFLAKVISKVTNPCILSVLVLLLMAYTGSGDIRVLLGWAAVVVLSLVLLPLIYIYLRTSKTEGRRELLAKPTVFLKQHPKDILVLGLLLGLPCLVVLTFLEAPLFLLATLGALLASSIVTALFNLYYRVSYHLAAVTVLVLMTALTWGQIYLVLLIVLPIVGWAKYRIREHTVTQLAIGITVSGVLIGIIIAITPIL
jgi:hypothetical protein